MGVEEAVNLDAMITVIYSKDEDIVHEPFTPNGTLSPY